MLPIALAALVSFAPAAPSPSPAPAPALVQRGSPRLAPFTAVRWRGETPEVRVDGTFYELLSIDGHTAEELVAFGKERFDGRWAKRFSEDLVQLMTEFGAAPGDTVDLRLKTLAEDAKVVTLSEVAMTAANRRATLDFNNRGARPARAEPKAPKRLSAPDARADLDALARILRDSHSYVALRGVDLDAATAAIAARVADGMDRASFALEVAELLASLGDGHTRLDESLGRILPPGRTPFLLMDAEGGVVCVRADRNGPFVPGHPFVESIAGLDIERWIGAAEGLSSGYSPQFRRRQAVESLRYIGYAAEALEVELGERFDLVVRDAGGATKSVRVPLTDRRALYGTWPRGHRPDVPQGMHYVRLERMDEDTASATGRALRAAQDAERVVLDVRGNGGGTRDALRAVYPWIAPKGSGPRVVNVARYRLRPGEEPGRAGGYLENRGLFPLDWDGWSDPERDAIVAFARDFTPTWDPGEEGFSRLHFMVLSPDPRATFDGEVKILVDAGCFSATDIFVGALKGLPNVELIGGATGGGSGRSRRAELPHSGLSLRVSSMVSWQPTGELYDGVGVTPHRVVLPVPAFFWGGRDAVLEAALRED